VPSRWKFGKARYRMRWGKPLAVAWAGGPWVPARELRVPTRSPLPKAPGKDDESEGAARRKEARLERT
jgi:hypothetical protein